MFNKNFNAMRQMALYGANAQINVSATGTSGTSYTSLYAQANNCALGVLDTSNDFNTFSYANQGVCLWIGNGTADESANDITMAVDPTQAVSGSNASTSFVTGTDISKGAYTVTPIYENGIAKIRYDRTFTALTNITVSEIVLSKGLQTGGTTGSAVQFMFYRKKLDTAKTFTAGQSFTISIVVSPYTAE